VFLDFNFERRSIMNEGSIPVPQQTPPNPIPAKLPLFPLGRIVATPAALAMLEGHGFSAITLLKRHQHGDWGALDAHDRVANELAVKDGSRILSAYDINGERIWIITEAVGEDGVSRSSTCILKPEEY
jgi:hypothetical protein